MAPERLLFLLPPPPNKRWRKRCPQRFLGDASVVGTVSAVVERALRVTRCGPLCEVCGMRGGGLEYEDRASLSDMLKSEIAMGEVLL